MSIAQEKVGTQVCLSREYVIYNCGCIKPQIIRRGLKTIEEVDKWLDNYLRNHSGPLSVVETAKTKRVVRANCESIGVPKEI